MKKQGWIIITLVAALLVAGTVWAFYPRRNARFVKLDNMGDQLFDTSVEAEKREEIGRKFGEEIEKLSEQDQQKYMENFQKQIMTKLFEGLDKSMDEFFAKSRTEQLREIDLLLADMKKAKEDPASIEKLMSSDPGRGLGMVIVMATIEEGNREAGQGAQSFGRNENGGNQEAEMEQWFLNISSPELRGKLDQYVRMVLDRQRSTM